MKTVKFVGMDVHQKTITIAIAEDGSRDTARVYGTIENDLAALDKFCRKMVSTECRLHFVYEAGPCGYGIYRHLTSKGYDCVVAAPSMIPRKSGERIKTDHRDAAMLARLHRAGELTPVYVPDARDEAIRDLNRAREDAVMSTRRAKQQLNAFLLRSGFVYSGKTKWSKAHFRWMADIAMPHAAQQITLQEYIDAVHENQNRVDRLTDQIRQMVSDWRLAPIVEALQAARGVSLIVAVTLVSEIGDLGRFKNPKHLMAYLGLVPSEHSSGESTKRGAITRTGNKYARKALIEASWTYRIQPRVSKRLLKRQEDLSEQTCRIAWKAQVRLCTRFRRLVARGKPKTLVVVAIARELSAFLWAIANQQQPIA